jgi:hypothetical protein
MVNIGAAIGVGVGLIAGVATAATNNCIDFGRLNKGGSLYGTCD